LTNTLNVPIVADALIEWSMEQNPEIGIQTDTVNPVVGEVNDGFLNDIQGRHVKKNTFIVLCVMLNQVRWRRVLLAPAREVPVWVGKAG